MDKLELIKNKLIDMNNECNECYGCSACKYNNEKECDKLFGQPVYVLESIIALEEMISNE